MLCHVMCRVLVLKVMLYHFVYVTLYYLMSVTLLSFCFHFAIDGVSAESRCTWSRSKHPNINAQGCIYKISYQRRQLHRSSTVWTKANGFLSSRPVILAEPGPAVSIPHKLQHQLTFGTPRHGGASRHAPALCCHVQAMVSLQSSTALKPKGPQ